jgi:hypothetical protein
LELVERGDSHDEWPFRARNRVVAVSPRLLLLASPPVRGGRLEFTGFHKLAKSRTREASSIFEHFD